jgi:hypothetical protein
VKSLAVHLPKRTMYCRCICPVCVMGATFFAHTCPGHVKPPQALEEVGVLDNTYVSYVPDNGEPELCSGCA